MNVPTQSPPRFLKRVAAPLVVLGGLFSCAQIDEQRTAPLLDGMGDLHFPVTTDDTLAQRYFDQGLVLAYAFNHAEALRSFTEASRLDPECAMCYWGAGLVLGPNINATMDPADVPEAFAATQKAVELAPAASEKERAFIGALATRYVAEAPEDRTALDSAYAGAMREVAQRYPDDADAVTLFAEALMDLSPWDYWTDEGDPRPSAAEFLEVLGDVMEWAPQHPGANHLYIHAVEAERPELGIAAADRLRDLVPGAGHLVHMPGHIYIRVGRYHDAVIANQKAIAADEAYSTQCHAQGLYPLAYMPHNHHFLWAAASLEGQSALAMEAARAMEANTDLVAAREPGLGTLQHYWITPMYAMIRFGQWGDVLIEPVPDADLLYPTAVWHYGRGLAHTRRGDLGAAEEELRALDAISEDPAIESVTVWDINTSRSLLHIAAQVLRGEIAAERGDYDGAIRHLTAAVELEDNLNYDEPPPWPMPVRQYLGAALLDAGRPNDAERVYLEDLEIFPANGWSLYGLARSLEAQGKAKEAAEVDARFEGAWQHADIEITASRM